MLSKEQLLEKGVAPEVADEIVASYSSAESSGSPLEDLQKALKGDKDKDDTTESLFKAEKKEEHKEPDGDEEEPDEEYMRKHMKKFMSKNKKECMKALKDMEPDGDEMKKAIDSIDGSAAGAIVEMEDLKPILAAQQEYNTGMLKAINMLADKMDLITGQNAESYDILTKAAALDVEIAKNINIVSEQPVGRKGVTAAVGATMAKAIDPNMMNNQLAYRVLAKAMSAGDRQAGQIISVLESAGKRVDLLPTAHKAYIADLINKEAK